MKILMCSDGSEQAERAVRLGTTIASGRQAQVTLLGISESKGESKALLDSLARSQALLSEKKLETELIIKSGKAVQEIVKRTQEANYDLVVIGAASKEKRGLFWMSSKTYKLIKEIRPPVLSVAGDSSAIKHILICAGGKQYIDHAVSLTGKIAQGVGSEVTLLHVVPELPAIYAQLPRMEETATTLLRSRSELGLNLRHEKEMLETLGVKVAVRLRHGPVLASILREIHEGRYDLVVIGSAPGPGLRTYVLGDISREVVNRANCAVLVVRSN